MPFARKKRCIFFSQRQTTAADFKCPEINPDDGPKNPELVGKTQRCRQHCSAGGFVERQEKFRKLLEISEALGDTVDLISPTRELVKEGKILRISARDGNRYERYMFLVSIVIIIFFYFYALGSIDHGG